MFSAMLAGIQEQEQHSLPVKIPSSRGSSWMLDGVFESNKNPENLGLKYSSFYCTC